MVQMETVGTQTEDEAIAYVHRQQELHLQQGAAGATSFCVPQNAEVTVNESIQEELATSRQLNAMRTSIIDELKLQLAHFESLASQRQATINQLQRDLVASQRSTRTPVHGIPVTTEDRPDIYELCRDEDLN